MILLIDSSACDFKCIISVGAEVSTIIGTILIIIYVIYTYRTFQQIKRQTDFQQDAYLKVEPKIVESFTSKLHSASGKIILRTDPTYTKKYIKNELSDKMAGILKPIFQGLDDSVFKGNYMTLFLTNYGNAEINKINLSISLVVKNTSELAVGKMLQESSNYNLTYTIDEIIERNKGILNVPLFETASFPIFDVIISGNYSDIRDKTYILPQLSYSGENPHFHRLPS